MNIQVGQWYRCRNKSLIAQVVGTVLQGEYAFAIVMYKGGEYYDVSVCTPNGRYLANDETHGFNLTEHLPECTGPGWKPARWRPATVDDLKRSMAAARFRDNDVQEWRHSHLCGARWVGQVIHWQDAGLNCWWLRCEILDDPS